MWAVLSISKKLMTQNITERVPILNKSCKRLINLETNNIKKIFTKSVITEQYFEWSFMVQLFYFYRKHQSESDQFKGAKQLLEFQPCSCSWSVTETEDNIHEECQLVNFQIVKITSY